MTDGTFPYTTITRSLRMYENELINNSKPDNLLNNNSSNSKDSGVHTNGVSFVTESLSMGERQTSSVYVIEKGIVGSLGKTYADRADL